MPTDQNTPDTSSTGVLQPKKSPAHTTIAIEVQDTPGVLTRISGLFSRRGFNIESLTVGHTHKPGISRFTVVCDSDEKQLEQVRKQSQKLIQVLTTTELTAQKSVLREYAMIKLCQRKTNPQLLALHTEYPELRQIHADADTVIFEVSAPGERISKIFAQLEGAEILESIRTGVVGMSIDPHTAKKHRKTQNNSNTAEGSSRPEQNSSSTENPNPHNPSQEG